MGRIERFGKPKKPAGSADPKLLLHLLEAAYRDYVAARVLLLEDLPLQGAIQASTAIEKAFKLILALRGNQSTGHLKRAHLNAVKNFNPSLYASLNEGFLELLRRVYKYRYPDDLKPGSGIVVATAEFLAELDQSAMAILASLTVTINGREGKTPIDQAMAREDPRLFRGNHVIGNIPKSKYIEAHPQLVYESRILDNGDELSMLYECHPTRSDGNFLRPALRSVQNEANTFVFSFRPLNPGDAPKPVNADESA